MSLVTDVTAEELQVFLEEAKEQIALLDRDIVALERNGGDPQLLQEIFRAAHTMKGSSAMLGHQRMAELTHAMESLLDLLRKGKAEISQEIVDCLLQGLDILKMLREELVLQEESDVDVASAVAKLREVAGNDLLTDHCPIGASPLPSREPGRDAAAACVESGEDLAVAGVPGGGDSSVQMDGNDKRTWSPTRQEERPVSQSVRVDVRTLDNLMNMVEELVIDRSRMVQINRMLESKYGDDTLIRELSRTSNHIVKVINELQHDVMRVRMLPIGTLFGSFPRLVRDLARQQGKTLNFVVDGEDTELDRTIIEKIRDPLVALLRNAVDHGVELPEERKAAGKAETAVVHLSAYQEEGHIVITLVDDGRGIEANRVRDVSAQKGLVATEEAYRLTDAEAMNLIFLAGMSTVETATEVSGRGVGLDVVKTNMEALGGSVRVESKLGHSTRFVIVLPLTVAVIQGLMVYSGKTTYILPMSGVTEILRLGPQEITTIKGREVIRLRDRIIPLVRIETVRCTERPAMNGDGARIVVIAGDMRKAVGIVVDELVDQQEFVVKPLGRCLTNARTLAGATILGDGRVGLVVDLPTLIRASTSRN